MPSKFVIIVSIPDYSPRCFELNRDHVKIGRGRNNHLILDNAAISSKHCELVKDVDSGEWSFRDLGSTNGSKANGHMVGDEKISIRDGDQILLGEEIKLLFAEVRQLESPEAEEPDEPIEVNPVAAAVARQVREDEQGGRTIRLNDKK